MLVRIVCAKNISLNSESLFTYTGPILLYCRSTFSRKSHKVILETQFNRVPNKISKNRIPLSVYYLDIDDFVGIRILSYLYILFIYCNTAKYLLVIDLSFKCLEHAPYITVLNVDEF